MSRGGRGRGGSTSNSKAILDKMGLQKSDIVADAVQSPTETFPPLQFKAPKPTEKESPLEKYPLMVKKEIREYLFNSKYNIQVEKSVKTIEHYSDKYLALLNVHKPLAIDFSRLPKELHPIHKVLPSKKPLKRTKTMVKPNLSKKIKQENMSKTLEELEKKELKEGDDSDDEDGEKEEERPEEVEELEEEQDEEMDEGTDYYQSYFDNGESYMDDDDDGLDEGGVM